MRSVLMMDVAVAATVVVAAAICAICIGNVSPVPITADFLAGHARSSAQATPRAHPVQLTGEPSEQRPAAF